jgi:septal ring factor EnvC (AmiA/AmiB activator)
MPWDRLLKVEQEASAQERRAAEEAGLLILRVRAEAEARRKVRLAAEAAEAQRQAAEAFRTLEEDHGRALASYELLLRQTPTDPAGFRAFVLGRLLDGT